VTECNFTCFGIASVLDADTCQTHLQYEVSMLLS